MAIYSDIDLTFTAHPVTGDIVKKVDAQAVLQSMKTLCLAAAEEILNQPTIGGNVYELLFEINDGLILHKIQSKIEEIVNIYENRVDLKSVSVTRMDNNAGVIVNVTFYFANQPNIVTGNFQLKRLR